MDKYYLGIDIGSTTFKAVVVDDNGTILHEIYLRTKPVSMSRSLSCTGHCVTCGACNQGALKKMVTDFLESIHLRFEDISCTVVTGSQIVEDTKKHLPYDLQVSEVSAHVAGALHCYPHCRAILDVGGQDSKAMIYNPSMEMWNSKMSGICAAGTGAFLDSVALKLNVPVEKMAELADYSSTLEFSSVCAVLSATSINKFKNRYPLGQIIAGACRAQARTIISGVGELLFHYEGDIVFQGGVASNHAVAHYLETITHNKILVPEHHRVMGALGAAILARKYDKLKNSFTRKEIVYPNEEVPLKSISMRANSTRKEFFSKNNKMPTVYRNLFFPTEILNALGVRIITLETYAALFARNARRVKSALDIAAYKGFSGETCSFLRVLEGLDLPQPAFGVSTSQPCQQGERIFQDLARQYNFTDRFFSLHTPASYSDEAVETVADGLQKSVELMEKAMGLKMDPGRLAEACDLSNQAAEVTKKCNHLRFTSPPLLRGSEAIYNAVLFSQLWGKKELVEIQSQYYEELLARKEIVEKRLSLNDTHRLLWLHLPPFYDTKILDYMELTCNAPIVFEEVNFVDWVMLNPDDPYRSLARKLLTVGYLDPQLRVKYIRENAKTAGLNGCVLYNHGFGRCSLADSCLVKHLREELRKVNLPLLQLDGDCMDQTTDPCSTLTKVSAFVEALNDRKYRNIFGSVSEK